MPRRTKWTRNEILEALESGDLQPSAIVADPNIARIYDEKGDDEIIIEGATIYVAREDVGR